MIIDENEGGPRTRSAGKNTLSSGAAAGCVGFALLKPFKWLWQLRLHVSGPAQCPRRLPSVPQGTQLPGPAHCAQHLFSVRQKNPTSIAVTLHCLGAVALTPMPVTALDACEQPADARWETGTGLRAAKGVAHCRGQRRLWGTTKRRAWGCLARWRQILHMHSSHSRHQTCTILASGEQCVAT